MILKVEKQLELHVAFRESTDSSLLFVHSENNQGKEIIREISRKKIISRKVKVMRSLQCKWPFP